MKLEDFTLKHGVRPQCPICIFRMHINFWICYIFRSTIIFDNFWTLHKNRTHMQRRQKIGFYTMSDDILRSNLASRA
jgi:hypothetical protein